MDSSSKTVIQTLTSAQIVSKGVFDTTADLSPTVDCSWPLSGFEYVCHTIDLSPNIVKPILIKERALSVTYTNNTTGTL